MQDTLLRGEVTTNGSAPPGQPLSGTVSASPRPHTFKAKWGPEVAKHGQTEWPNVLLEYEWALGLKAHDVLLLIHIARYCWKAGDSANVFYGTLARQRDYATEQSASNAVKRLEAKGFIEVASQFKGGKQTKNAITLDGLHYIAAVLAQHGDNLGNLSPEGHIAVDAAKAELKERARNRGRKRIVTH